MACHFQSLIKTPAGFNAKLVDKLAELVRANLRIKKDWEFSVLVVSPAYIRRLNRTYRGKDKVTDVLSFSQQEGTPLILPQNKQLYLGDIILCFSQIEKQAKIFGHSQEREFSLLVIHGLLHLLGYEDKNEKQYQAMAKIQDKVLAKIYGQSKQVNKKF